MLLMGWDGTEVTPQIRHLIEVHHLGSIILTAKNLKCQIASSIYPLSFPALIFYWRSSTSTALLT